MFIVVCIVIVYACITPIMRAKMKNGTSLIIKIPPLLFKYTYKKTVPY